MKTISGLGASNPTGTPSGAQAMRAIGELGTFTRRGEDLDVRFERHYPHPVEKVWSAITDPKRLSDWMGAAVVEPRVGGRMDLIQDNPNPASGRIRVWEPPKVLEFTWSNNDSPNSVVRYELTRDGTGTRMVFSHKNMPYVVSALMMPGWHFLFARMESLLDGAATPESKQTWRELQAIYVDHYQLVGAMLDHPTEA